MIKFFRKIRQKMLIENKFSKYLLYAIGEIILVVLGILIALQINNWNEQKKNRAAEIKYLNGINSNLIVDLSELELLFKEDTTRLNAYVSLVRVFNNPDSLKYKYQDIVSSFYSTAGYVWFEGQNVGFEDMKSSGKLNLIQSDTIKYAIQKYYRFFEEVIKQENLHNDMIRSYNEKNLKYINVSSFLEPTFTEQWNGNTGPPSLSFLQSPNFAITKSEIIDNLSIMKSNQYSSHTIRMKFYKDAVRLNNMIEQYLLEKEYVY